MACHIVVMNVVVGAVRVGVVLGCAALGRAVP